LDEEFKNVDSRRFYKSHRHTKSMLRIFGKLYGATGLGLFAERIAQLRYLFYRRVCVI